MTLKDIAKAAGVSVSTVSRVLSDKNSKAASKEVRDRIWDVVRRTGYRPNTSAQQLRKAAEGPSEEEKHYFAFIYARSADNKDMFFSELANAIEFEAYKHNYILKYSFYAEDLGNRSFQAAISSNEISGIVVLGRFSEERVNAIAETQKNVVYVGLNYYTKRHDAVFCDGYLAGKTAMNTLLEYGHTKIAYIGEMSREKRYQSYWKTLEEAAIPLNYDLIVETKQTLDGGYRAALDLLKRGRAFTAIFCANDATAMGAIKGLKENQLRVPEDVSVISIDDVEMARYFTPMLTTVHIPITELGCQAARTLIDRIEYGHSVPIKLELPFSLSRRDSCMPLEKGETR